MKDNKYFLRSIFNRIRRKRQLLKPGKIKRSLIKRRDLRASAKGVLIKLIVALLVLLIINYLILPYFISIFSFDLKPVDGTEKEEAPTWFGGSRMTLLFIGLDRKDPDHPFVDKIMLFVIDPHSENIGILNINSDLNVFVPKVERSINLRSSYGGLSEGEGLENLITATEALLALRIDKYLLVDVEGYNELVDSIIPPRIEVMTDIIDLDLKSERGIISEWSKGVHTIYSEDVIPFLSSDSNGSDEQLARQLQYVTQVIKDLNSFSYFSKLPSILVSLENNIRTNLNEVEFFFLMLKFRNVRSDQIKQAYTREMSWDENNSFGVYKEHIPIIESIDSDLSTILMNTEIVKEQARIEVLNGSGIRGLANSRSRWITNSGGRVIYLGNSPESEKVTKVYVNKDKKEKLSKTISEIEKIFNEKIEYPEEEYKYKHLGDIVIIIGEEYE